MTCPVVPEQDTGQSLIAQPLYASPYSLAWWVGQTITNIPADSVGWLVAQGWQITDITYDDTTTPPTPYYSMQRESLRNWEILQSLLNSYTEAQNLAFENNTIRYNDIVASWSDLIETSHDQFESQTNVYAAHETDYLATLNDYITEVDGLLDASQAQLDNMEPDYTFHASDSPNFLIGLGATELARINEEFAAQLDAQLQQLTDKGFYSSPLVSDITERNARDRDEQIQQLNDRLNREKLENEHRLYEQKVAMRSRILDGTSSIVATTLNQANVELTGKQAKYEDCLRLTTYQLDERNKLHIGLYGFVERRDDAYPSFQELTQLIVGLSDSGGGWVNP